MEPRQKEDAVLETRDLSRSFRRKNREIRAVAGVNLTLRPGECLGLVGESGSGKSTLARMLASVLVPTEGEVLLRGEPVSCWRAREGRGFYRHVQMVFQNPASAISPRMTIGEFVTQGLLYFHLCPRSNLRGKAQGLLESVGLSGEFLDRLPHQLSGGELQRAVIARAISVNPDVLILDEATSALDASIQRQILDLIDDLRRSRNIACLLITHDLALVRRYAERVGILYGGELVELMNTSDLCESRCHPYTQSLLRHMLFLGQERKTIAAEIPDIHDKVSNGGCPYFVRCAEHQEVCTRELPRLRMIAPDHLTACILRHEI